MSGQYRFGQEPAQSPFNRQPQQNNQNVSYKTNINRMKTKKWVEAKKNAYDGDDWGDYDEYDEYGVDEPPPPPVPAKSYGQPSRSFTEPMRQPAPQLARRGSFEAGDEHRSFSAAMPPPPSQGYAQQQQPPQANPQRQVSAASDFSDTPQHRRDFDSSALPPPLHTKVCPTQATFGSPTATSPRQRAPSTSDKPLPFIRPADIYKRVEEERQRERASLDSQRPSLDSLGARPKEDVSSPDERSLQPLETVAERKSEYLPDLDVAKQPAGPEASQASQPQSLPQLPGITAFDNDFWSGGQQSQVPTSHSPVVSQQDDQGFRSVVDQAFTRRDDQHSVPPTPISKEDDSIVSRSNTGSTSGISPIMSRVPSSATSALKNRNQAGMDGSTPVIAEETSEANTPVSRPTSMAALGAPMVARKPSPAHSRNVSSSSLPRSGLATPTRGESPARSPALAPQRNLPEPESAQLASSNPLSPASESDYTTREADIAAAMKLSLEKDAPELRSAEKQSQDAFLESHKAQSPVSDVVPRSRSESPSKNRVQALAGKFGDVSHSRRGSTQSNASVESWEKSQRNSRAASPTKGLANNKPLLKTEDSFRPKLPGQWESFATTAATPSEQGDKEKELGAEKDAIRTIQGISSPLEEVDLAPTTSKHPVSATEPSKPLPFTKNTPESEDAPTPPPKDPSREATSPTSPKDVATPQLSTDLSADDQESDRLRKEIVASLTPVQTEKSAVDANPASLRAVSPSGTNRASSILPSEYDSYWEDSPSHGATPPAVANQSSAVEPSDPLKSGLLTRFSWEDKTSSLVSPEGQTRDLPAAQEPKSSVAQEPKSIQEVKSTPVDRSVQEESKESFDIPEPYFGPTHTPAIAEPIQESKASDRAPTPPQEAAKLTSPTHSEIDREPTPVSGLHVVNSALNPEAVDLPPRLSAEASPETQPTASHEEPSVSQQTKEQEPTESAVSPIATQEPAPHSPTAQSPTSDKPLGFRDIVTLKSSSDRIEKYNHTRDYWAHADHGLGNWIASAVEANPDLATQAYPQVRPELSHSATTKHKHTGSISLFGQHHSGANETPTTPTSSGNPSPFGSHAGRITSHQMQAKGKDLLHTAGVLGGKGMTGAKGLFAKGKSRFGRDKVDK